MFEAQIFKEVAVPPITANLSRLCAYLPCAALEWTTALVHDCECIFICLLAKTDIFLLGRSHT